MNKRLTQKPSDMFEVFSPLRQRRLGVAGIICLGLLSLGGAGLLYFVFSNKIADHLDFLSDWDAYALFYIMLLMGGILFIFYMMVVVLDRIVLFNRYYIGRKILVQGTNLRIAEKDLNISGIYKMLTISSRLLGICGWDGRTKYVAVDHSGEPIFYLLDNYENADELFNFLRQNGCGFDDLRAGFFLPNLLFNRYSADIESIAGEERTEHFFVRSPRSQRFQAVFSILLYAVVLAGSGWLAYFLVCENVLQFSHDEILIWYLIWYIMVFVLFVCIILPAADILAKVYLYNFGKVIAVEKGSLKVGGSSWDLSGLEKLVQFKSTGNKVYECVIYDKNGKPAVYLLNNYDNYQLLERLLAENGCLIIQNEADEALKSGFASMYYHIRQLFDS